VKSEFKKKESELFIKCVELEESLELIEDSEERALLETQITEMQKALDLLRRENSVREKTGRKDKLDKVN
jgi:hypothetical protein